RSKQPRCCSTTMANRIAGARLRTARTVDRERQASSASSHQLRQPCDSGRDAARFIVGQRPAVEMPAKSLDEIDIGHRDAIGRVHTIAAGGAAHAPGRWKTAALGHRGIEEQNKNNRNHPQLVFGRTSSLTICQTGLRSLTDMRLMIIVFFIV